MDPIKDFLEIVKLAKSDGWDMPDGRSVVAEVYPVLWSRNSPKEGRTPVELLQRQERIQRVLSLAGRRP